MSNVKFNLDNICSNSKILIIGPKLTGKKTVSTDIINKIKSDKKCIIVDNKIINKKQSYNYFYVYDNYQKIREDNNKIAKIMNNNKNGILLIIQSLNQLPHKLKIQFDYVFLSNELNNDEKQKLYTNINTHNYKKFIDFNRMLNKKKDNYIFIVIDSFNIKQKGLLSYYKSNYINNISTNEIIIVNQPIDNTEKPINIIDNVFEKYDDTIKIEQNTESYTIFNWFYKLFGY